MIPTLRNDVNRAAGSVGSRVASSVTLLWTTNVLMRIMQLATTTILARLLTPADYGLVALAATIVGFIDLISNLQIGGAVARIQNITDEHLGTAFAINLIRGVVTTVLLMLLAQPIAGYMHDARLVSVLYMLSLSAIMSCLHNPQFLLFARDIDYRREAQRNAIAAIGGSFAGIVTVIVFPSYWALVVASLATSFIAMALSYWRVPRPPRINLKKRAEFLSYGLWLIFISILDYANNKVDYLLIGRGLGNLQLGAYHVGQQVMTMATADVVAPLGQVLLPAFSIISTDPHRLKTAYRRLQSTTLALVLPLGLGASALAPDIILLLVGKQWEQAIPVIRFLAPLAGLQGMVASVESLALATNNGRHLATRTIVFLCARTVLMLTGYYLGGFIGIIYARVISGSFFLLYSLGLAAWLTQSQWYDPILAGWRSLVSSGVMWGALYIIAPLLPWTSFPQLLAIVALKVLIGAGIYIGLHLLLWKMSGYPSGTEQKLLEQIRRLTRRILPLTTPGARLE